MSTLETYKKLAKQLVRWHRDGNYSIGERIRGLPRYRMLTDKAALALKFPLSEAQEIIAREAGYESWVELKDAVDSGMQHPKRQAGPAKLQRAIPVIFVADVKASAEFFRDKLKFSIDFLHGHPAFYGAVSRDGATLHLRFVHESIFKDGIDHERPIACFIVVENIKSLYDEYVAAGAEMESKLIKEPWGGTTFAVHDLDGNSIYFSS